MAGVCEGSKRTWREQEGAEGECVKRAGCIDGVKGQEAVKGARGCEWTYSVKFAVFDTDCKILSNSCTSPTTHTPPPPSKRGVNFVPPLETTSTRPQKKKTHTKIPMSPCAWRVWTNLKYLS